MILGREVGDGHRAGFGGGRGGLRRVGVGLGGRLLQSRFDGGFVIFSDHLLQC